MKIIGLTGGIASGKSTVSAILRELGATVIDADQVAREVVKRGRPAWKKIKEEFGKEYFLRNGEIDRRKLGELVFSDRDALARLNAITHPYILDLIKTDIQKLKREGKANVVVIDAALLIETGLHRLVDQVWLVSVPWEVQIERLMRRDGITRDRAIRRISSQMSLEEKKRYADRIIDNSGDIKATRNQVKNLWNELVFREARCECGKRKSGGC